MKDKRRIFRNIGKHNKHSFSFSNRPSPAVWLIIYLCPSNCMKTPHARMITDRLWYYPSRSQNNPYTLLHMCNRNFGAIFWSFNLGMHYIEIVLCVISLYRITSFVLAHPWVFKVSGRILTLTLPSHLILFSFLLQPVRYSPFAYQDLQEDLLYCIIGFYALPTSQVIMQRCLLHFICVIVDSIETFRDKRHWQLLNHEFHLLN